MIRLLFVLFVTLGGFAALAVWSASEGEVQGVAEKIVSPDLRAAMQAEVDRLVRTETAPKPAAVEPPVARLPEPPRRVLAEPSQPAPPKPQVEETHPAAVPPTSEAVARKGAGGSVTPSDDAVDSVVELAELAAPAEFAPDFGPASDRGTESSRELIPTGDEEVAAGQAEWDEAPHDADRSARLIRRMIAVYRDAGASR